MKTTGPFNGFRAGWLAAAGATLVSTALLAGCASDAGDNLADYTSEGGAGGTLEDPGGGRGGLTGEAGVGDGGAEGIAGQGGSGVGGASEPSEPQPSPTWAGSPNLEDGLKGRTDILGFEDFESSSWGTRWGMTSTPGSLTQSTVFRGTSSLRAFVRKGSHEAVNFFLPISSAGAPDAEELYFRYYVYYPTGWVRDEQQVGKMPGFYGAKDASGCNESTKNWSARGINADEGSNMTVGYYVYHQDRTHSDGCGDSKYSPVLMAKNKWHAVEGYIKLNTPGQNDGILRQWVNGAKQIDASGYRFRIDSTSPKVKGVWFHVYVGGSWSAPQDMECYFDNLVISRNPIGLMDAP